MLLDKEILGLIASALTVLGIAPYLRDMLRGTTKPHVFSWLIWTFLTALSFFAQIKGGAGAGAWATGGVAFACGAVTVLALPYGEKNITRSDVIAFCGAILSLALWLATTDPLLTLVALTIVDVFAFYPTFRKSWGKPWEETLFSYGCDITGYGLALLALDHYTLTTMIYLVFCNALSVTFVMMTLYRRKVLGSATHDKKTA